MIEKVHVNKSERNTTLYHEKVLWLFHYVQNHFKSFLLKVKHPRDCCKDETLCANGNGIVVETFNNKSEKEIHLVINFEAMDIQNWIICWRSIEKFLNFMLMW